MPRLKMPIDRASATDVMMKFPEMAYSLNHKDTFQKAISILYGTDLIIKTDLAKRMIFSCQICNREMNSENAMTEHCRSGVHQKNLDKKSRDMGESSYRALRSHYGPNSLHFKLLCSRIKPLGLQMVEEYEKGTFLYYKCNLCGAHGTLDIMYHHLIGKKHTEKYIKSACVLRSSILTSKEREELRLQLVKLEGINCEAIKTIKGSEYYPYKWKQEGQHRRERLKSRIKEEPRSPSSSPSPGPSRNISVNSCRSSHGSYIRSPELLPQKSLNTSLRHSPICPERKTKHSPKSPETPWTVRSRELSPLSRYRNRSPPLSHVSMNKDGVSGDCAEKPLFPLSEFMSSLPPLPPTIPPPPLPPPLPPMPPVPPPPPSQLGNSKDKGVQKFDLEELMTQLNFIVKTHGMMDSEIQNREDAKLAIDLMFKISEALTTITRIRLEDCNYKSEETIAKLKKQKLVLSKIMGYIKFRMEAAWDLETET